MRHFKHYKMLNVLVEILFTCHWSRKGRYKDYIFVVFILIFVFCELWRKSFIELLYASFVLVTYFIYPGQLEYPVNSNKIVWSHSISYMI